MASFQRDKGYLVIQFYFPKRTIRREYLGVLDSRENRRKSLPRLHDIEYQLKKGTFDLDGWLNQRRKEPSSADAPPLTLGSYARRWLDGQSHLRSNTVKQLAGIFRNYLDETSLGNIDIRGLSRYDIRDAIQGKAVRRTQMFLGRLRTILNEAVIDGLLLRNPALGVKGPEKEEAIEPVEPLSASEQSALLGAAEGSDRLYIRIALATGLRPGEIIAAQRRDIDFERRRLTVHVTKARRPYVRYADLSATAIAALRELVAASNDLGPLFTGGRGKKWQWNNWRRRNWDVIVARAGIRQCTPYVLRHTYAVEMLIAGHDKVYVAKQMGHTSTTMIDKVYGRWTNRAEAASK